MNGRLRVSKEVDGVSVVVDDRGGPLNRLNKEKKRRRGWILVDGRCGIGG